MIEPPTRSAIGEEKMSIQLGRETPPHMMKLLDMIK